MTSPFAEDLRSLYASLRPRTVGTIFVEDLAHVPLDDFLRGGSRIWIVDWWRGRPHQAIATSLVTREGGQYACLGCEGARLGSAVCASFVAAQDRSARVCTSFVPMSSSAHCARFALGMEPTVIVADAAMGRVSCFSMRVEELVARAGDAREALEMALTECASCSEMDQPLDLPSGSLDLAISVMLPTRMGEVSFSHVRATLRRRFGASCDSPRLAPLFERLRASIFRMQVEAYLRELHRLVDKSRGYVYLATEPVAPAKRKDQWDLVPGVPLLFELIHRHFTFDFKQLEPASFLRSARTADGRSQVVQAVLLAPRKRLLANRGAWCAHPDSER